ncbi:proprotein convertase subtilisin/kexin type 7 [Procambarus clarkii]|uniref:proprotein convertase subtilisin/kexin type 7 n=1 Tax=Procambarus clarkii TaxID=6728 RepID=UPI0037420B8E
MMETSTAWQEHREKHLTMYIGIHHPFCQLKPPWCTLLCALMINFTTLVSAKNRVDPSELHHRGDLHFFRESRVHSLAWVVEIREECHVREVIDNFRKIILQLKNDSSNEIYAKFRYNQSQNFLSSLNKDSDQECSEKIYPLQQNSCFCDIPLQLILVRKLTFFKNMYIIAHPYFRFYSQSKRKWKVRQNRRVQSVITSNRSALFGDYRKPVTNSEVDFLKTEACMEHYFSNHPCIKYAKQEVLRPRQKRSKVEFLDPLYEEQWHLKNGVAGQYDINVVSAWESGITGRGVTVCVIDDGLEWQHPDLRDNYNPAGSYDLNSDDPDPSPVKNGERNEHGTRCAGEIAAVANSVCGVGVAYRANISGIRVLGGRMTDTMEAAAFIQGLEVNDVYSCSWGPDDDGKTVDGPHHLASRALVHGITYGRKGYGAIYVVASGNGGRNKDNCNFDGYANSVYTVTIGAVDFKGRMPYYAEECAAMLAVTPSSGSNGRDIVTTDWSEISPSGCTKHHSGTSAAAPLAAAVIALAFEVQPCLSWRDVQYLIALTSRKIDTTNSDWAKNGAGLHHSHQHGFGLIDAAAMVSAATIWESVPFSTTYTSEKMVVQLPMPSERLGEVMVKHTVDEQALEGYALNILEFVQVRVTVEHDYRGSLNIVLVCPSGTRSTLAAPREADNSTKGLVDWPLGTVRCWGENPVGTYQVTVMQTRHQHLNGRLVSWQLVLHGTSMTPSQLQERKRLVEKAVRGEVVHVNRSTLCHPPELRFEPFEPLPERWLKVLVITGFFLMFMAIFNSLEYIFCYNDEKEKFYKKLQDVSAGRAMHQRNVLARRNTNADHHYGSIDDGSHSQDAVETHLPTANPNEIVPLMVIERETSPSPSCDADISSLDCDSDEGNLSSHCTSDTVIPKDTDVTDFTNDEFLSEVDEDRRILQKAELMD